MANVQNITPCARRPTLTDIEAELLRSILAQEIKFFEQTCNKVDASANCPEEVSVGGENSSPLEKIATSLLKHGSDLQEIYHFFKKLTHRRYLMKLACPLETDNFQVVTHVYRAPYSGSATPEVTNKENGSQLHPQELEVYECALFAAQYPVLATSHESSDITTHSARAQSDQSDLELSLSPASRECMLYGRSVISRTRLSVFEIEPEDLTELVRQAFCLTHRRHEYYLKEYKKTVMDDPAKVLVKEIREQLLILNSECHPYFHSNLFRRREDYEMWLEIETSALENIARNQEKFVQAEVKSFPSAVPLVSKDKHSWYKRLLVKLFRAESVQCRINVGTREAIPKEPLSPASLRLLEEFGERYRIGLLYRKVSLLEYLARNFEYKRWYCNYVISVIESILDYENTEVPGIVTRDEIKMIKSSMTYLHGYVEHALTRVNRVFPKNAPEGGLKEVIRVLSWLIVVDQDEIFGEHKGITVGQYLKTYVKEEMLTNYERQKIIVADQLKLRTFGQQLTPRFISLMILDISEKLRNYRMYFKQEFIGYFDIVEMAVEVFYGLLMEDILELCNIYPVNQQRRDIDYLMIALAYRLTSFDQDTAWENYLSLERQIWRPSFLKHSFVWMSSLYEKLHQLILTALHHDRWQGHHTNHTSCSGNSIDSQRLCQSVQRTRPRVIPSPLIGSEDIRSITPSRNSAFVQVSSRLSCAGGKEFPNHAPLVTSSEITNQPLTSDVTGEQPSCSNIDKKPMFSRTPCSNLLKYVQNTRLASSVTSQSSESVYTDARSHISDVDEYASCDDAESAIENDLGTSPQDYTTIPISSSLIDTVSGINRLVNVIRHFSQLLCPNRPSSAHDSFRMSPEDRHEIKETLEQGRMNMARKLGDMIESLALFYGYYVISCESCDVSNELLEHIIGQRCLTRSLSLTQENGVRPCRHRSAGFKSCNTANSQGNCGRSCIASENNSAQSERVVVEMCVRLNDVRTMKKLLSTLVEIAVENVLAPDSRKQHAATTGPHLSDPNLATTSQESGEPSPSASVSSDVLDRDSIERTVEELQEIEDGLVKLMAYRANDVIKKLLQLLLTLNLRCFNSQKRLQPVLNAARKTVHTLAVNLYPDCYAAVLRHFWLAIVKNFAEEKEKLLFLHCTAKDQANLLLEATSYFIEIFRAEEDSIPLAFVSASIEPVLQSLNYYTLPTRTLTQMYEALQQRNTNAVRISDSLSSRHRYQRPPSNLFIVRLRIQLHSQHAHFSGQQFVECVSDRIREEGNLGLGICAVPNGFDADSGKVLGKYLLDNDILCYVGKVVEKTSDHDSDDDDDLEEELRRYTGTFFISGKKPRQAMFNDVAIVASQEIHSSVSEDCAVNDSSTIIQEDTTEPPRFVSSDNRLYKFKSLELDESLSSYHPEYHQVPGDNASLRDITTVLFSRRNIDQGAREFLSNIGTDAILEELHERLRVHSRSNCCWSRAPPF